MNPKLAAALLLTVLSASFLVAFVQSGIHIQAQAEASPDIYFGTWIGYGDINESKALINRVSSFTNFVLIGTTSIVYDSNELNETFQYAFDHGMSFMSLTPSLPFESWTAGVINQTEFFRYSSKTWGNHLLGFETVDDEPGGKALDNPPTTIYNGSVFEPHTPSTNEEMGDFLRFHINNTLYSIKEYRTNGTTYPLFTADYALYSMDYQGGYDGIFAEYVGNYSRQLTTSLIRGAATVQHKDWGVLINWKYDQPPYLESGPELLDDMVYAYNSGAKYILVFDTNKKWTQDILQPEHIQALQDFNQYVHDHPRSTPQGRTALVLPADYGCGFRGPNDKIWGTWPQDSQQETDLSSLINPALTNLMQIYGDNLDIVYQDTLQTGNSYDYSSLIYWNDPAAQPTPSPSRTPAATPTPTPTLNPSTSPSPSPSPTTSLSPSISPSPSSTVSSSATLQATGSPDPADPPATYLFALVTVVVLAAVVIVVVLVARRRRSAT